MVPAPHPHPLRFRDIEMPTPHDVIVLAIGQALTSTVVSLLTSVSSLSGNFLAPYPTLSTLPVTATVIGTLIMIYPASTLMGRLGRRCGFMFKAGVGIVGGATAMMAMVVHNFPLLVLGTFLLGIFSAFGQYYRFAAIDAAKDPAERAIAVAIVTGAGVAGGIAGPYLGGRFAEAVPEAPYAGAFMVLSLVCVALALSQLLLSADLGRDKKPGAPDKHPADTLILGGPFLRVSLICAIGFAVMTLTMNAAPLSIHHSGLSVHDSATVLQAHFALMYLPSFFNPILIKYIGLRGLVLLGVFASAVGCILSAVTEQTLTMYILELGLSGIGWNFMFNGGTLLLASTYSPALKTKAQGFNAMLVYSANVAASFAAGALMANAGWVTLNLVGLPLLLIAVWSLRTTIEELE